MVRKYICYTIYHLLIALCKYESGDVIYIGKDVFLDREMERKLEEYKVKIFLVDEFNVSQNDDIYIFNDWESEGDYLRRNKIYYHLIEDGYNYHSYNIRKLFYKRKNLLAKYIFTTSIPFGYSKYCLSIEVNNKSKVVRDKRYKKMIEVPRKQLFLNLTIEKRNMLKSVFNIPIQINKAKSVLILTQPLSSDTFFTDVFPDKKSLFNYYKGVANSYINQGYSVFIKIHPRDKLDYSLLGSEVILLSKRIPMEIYELFGNYHFNIGITHSSTALEFLTCVDEKIFLADLRA